jgi:prepilin-type N-terminal cleavage/methylation domain-containing protein
MKKIFSAGFTLIELLVVIAIISLLSSVILAALDSARAKGADATIKGDMNGIFKQAEIVYDAAFPNSYAGVCSNPTIEAAIQSASSASSGYNWIGNGSTRDYNCTNAANTWVVVVKLKTAGAGWLCMDNTTAGTYKTEASQPGLILTVCP